MFHREESDMSAIPNLAKALALATVAAGAAFAQPTPPPAPYIACGTEPPPGPVTDTVVAQRQPDGFISIFNGTDFTGWWQSCVTQHKGPAKWKVVPEEKGIFSTQDGSNGGVLMTKKKYLHYELVWDYWPDFRNDGGLFNRTPANGRCFQTVLDYLSTGGFGGTWGENGFASRDYRPFAFGSNENTIAIPGKDNGEPSNWTVMTSKMKAAGEVFDCPNTGCTQADWNRLWDADGWNQLRVKFYGGVPGNQRVRMKFWFRKSRSNAPWTPVSFDTTLTDRTIDSGYIGLQVHWAGRFSGPRGTWYRDIKVRRLSELGVPVDSIPTFSAPGAKAMHDIVLADDALVGTLDSDYEIEVGNILGRTVQVMRGRAGRFEHRFLPHVNGNLTLRIKTARGVQMRTIVRDPP
jgi:hypothetical protein